MAQFSVQIGQAGALLTVYVGVSSLRAAMMVLQQQQVPLPVQALLQIDTGASLTHIDQGIINGLGLQPTGAVTTNTPSSGTNGVVMNTYDVSLVAVGFGMVSYTLGIFPVIGADFSAQGIGGLLGRDILTAARLVYSGPDNLCFMSV